MIIRKQGTFSSLYPYNPCVHEPSQSWATSLPPDVGYDELVDIRTVQAPWPTLSSFAGRERRIDFGDGSMYSQCRSSGERSCRTSNREFDSDEASLWWYTYARMEGPHAMGLPHEVSTAEFDGGNKMPIETTKKRHHERASPLKRLPSPSCLQVSTLFSPS